MPPNVYGAQSNSPSSGLWGVGLALMVAGAAAGLYFGGVFNVSSHLTLQSTPPGATVFINGRLIGPTPVSLGELRAGEYCLRIEKEGFMPLVKNIALASGELSLLEKLERCGKGSLNIDIRPYGAEVLLDGESFGHTPLQRDDVIVGMHDLLIRKTNFKAYAQRIDVTANDQLAFKDFGLEDIVLGMLRSSVEKDKQRVSMYMDLGHYLFVNNEMDESAEVYAKALKVANTPIVFEETADAQERALEQRLRAEDMNRLNEEIRKKSHWPGKDVAKWASVLKRQQEEVAGSNPADWNTVNEQVQNFIRDERLERAQTLLLQHLAVVKDGPLVPQAYVSLISLRLKMHNLEGLRDTFGKFSDLYGSQPALARQAANTIYTAGATFQGEPQKEVLGMAEKLLRRSVTATQRGHGENEMNALCKFELANVLTLQSRGDQAVAFYRDSIEGTRDASTRELRSQKLVDCHIKNKSYAEARAVLSVLAASPRPDVVRKAAEDLRLLEVKAKEELKQDEVKGPSPEQK